MLSNQIVFTRSPKRIPRATRRAAQYRYILSGSVRDLAKKIGRSGEKPMGYKLSPEERRRYDEEGLVIPATSLSPQLFEKVKSAVGAVIDDNGKVRREFTLVAHVPPR